MYSLLFDTIIIRIYNSNNHISMIKWSQAEREEQKERNTTLTTTTNQLLLPSSSSLNSTKIIYQQAHLSLPSYSHPFTPSPPPHIHTLHCPDLHCLAGRHWHCAPTRHLPSRRYPSRSPTSRRSSYPARHAGYKHTTVRDTQVHG